MKFKTNKLAILLVIGLIFPLILNYNFNLSNDFTHEVDKPRTSATEEYIIINALATTNTAYSGNWTWARAQPWCATGNGTKEYPYIIENVTIIFPPAVDCLTIRNSRKYFIVRNCTFKDIPVASFAGIRLNNVTNGKIIDNQVYNNSYGIDCLNVNNSQFIDNNCSDNIDYGMYFNECDNNTISGNIANNNRFGIYFQYGCDNNTISGNTANDNNNEGLSMYDGCDSNNIMGNTANDNNWGIFFEENHDNTLSGNTANGNRYGITIYSESSNNTVSGNTANNNEITGIYLDNYCQYNTVSGNIANNNTDNGIEVYDSDNNTISGNTANNNTLGIYIHNFSYNNTVSGNIANDNGNSGIFLTNSHHSTISGNNLNDNDDYGIYLDNSDSNHISENLANGNGFVGIHLNSQCSNSTISGNTANDNADSGIYFDGNDKDNIISGNIACNNNVSGIYLESSNNNNNTISGNTISNNLIGIFIHENSNENTIYENFFLINGHHAVDNGTNNKWNSTTIGNYWDNHTGPDVNDDGIVDIQYNISGTAGSIDYLPIAEDGAPAITINSPDPGDAFDGTAPSFNVRITDDYLVELWYTIDGGLNNYTFTANGTIDPTAWSAFPDGPATITFHASDIPGNIGSAVVNIEKDSEAPTIDITSPIASDLFGVNAPLFNVRITDDHLDTMWYSLDGGLTNIPFSTNGTIDPTAWLAVPDGLVTITFNANDTLGHLGTAGVNIEKESEAPTIGITSPTASDLFGVNAPLFNVRITDDNLDTMWYTLDGGLHNYTFTANGTIDQPAWNAMGDGTITLQFYANDTLGHIGTAGVNIEKDTVAPIITINSPSPGAIFGNDAPSFDVTVTDPNLDSVWLVFEGVTLNLNNPIVGTINDTVWSALPEGNYTITFHANDTLGHATSEAITITKDVPSKAGIGLDYFMTSFLIFIMGGMAIIVIITRIHQKKRITPA